jgi:hypothetical protein
MRKVVACNRFEQTQLGRTGDNCDGVEYAPRVSVELGGPRQNGVADRGRDVFSGRTEHFGDEERIATRASVELVGVNGMQDTQDTQHPHGFHRQRRQRGAFGALRSRQSAEDDPQWMLRVDFLVAIGGEDERPGTVTRRPSRRSRSSVASSAQCTSSSTRTVRSCCSSSSSTFTTSCGTAPAAVRVARVRRFAQRCRRSDRADVG